MKRGFSIGAAGWVLAAGLVGSLVVGGLVACAGPGAAEVSAASPRGARVVVVNQTDFAWRLEFTPRSGQADARLVAEVAPRGVRELTVRSGGYGVRMEVLPSEAGGPEAREEEVVLVDGKVYRWPLGTLLAAPDPGR